MQLSTYMCLAITWQARALHACRGESHNASTPSVLNHFAQIRRQKRTQQRYSSPPASFAVRMTPLVMMLLLGFVIRDCSNSYGITCSIWYLRRSATFVTSFAGSAGFRSSLAYAGSTVQLGLVNRIPLCQISEELWDL